MPELEPGVRIECCRCHQAAIEDGEYIAKGLHPSTVIRHLMAISASSGWDFIEAAGKAFAICPLCQGGEFDAKTKCPMCGHAKVATRFCTGADCRRGIKRRHLHRTCGRCSYDWMQTTKADAPPQPAPAQEVTDATPV